MGHRYSSMFAIHKNAMANGLMNHIKDEEMSMGEVASFEVWWDSLDDVRKLATGKELAFMAFQAGRQMLLAKQRLYIARENAEHFRKRKQNE